MVVGDDEVLLVLGVLVAAAEALELLDVGLEEALLVGVSEAGPHRPHHQHHHHRPHLLPFHSIRPLSTPPLHSGPDQLL